MKFKNSYYLTIVLLVGICTLFHANSFGQSVMVDTAYVQQTNFETQLLDLLGEDLDSTQLSFIKEQNYLNQIDPKQLVPFEELRAVFSNSKAIGNPKKLLRPKITFQNIYTDNLISNSRNDDASQWYSNVILSSSGNIAGVPLTVEGRLVTANGKMERKLSSIQLSFDARQFLSSYKTQLTPSASTFLNDITDTQVMDISLNTPEMAVTNFPVGFNSQDKEMLKNELKFQLYQSIITDKRFVDLISSKDSLQIADNSLHNAQDSLAVNQQNLEETLNNEKDSASKILSNYQQMWEKRKTYYGDSLNVVKEKLAQQSDEIKELQNTSSLREKLISKKDLPLFQKILAATKKLNVGRAVLEDSWYTIKSQPILGVQYAIELKKITAEVAYGKQVYNTNFSPILNPKLFRNLNGGKILFAKINYALSDKAQVAYSFTNIKDPGNFSQGLIVAPKSNSVYAISGSSQLTDKLNLKTEFALSRTAWGRPDLNESRQLTPRNMAGEATFVSMFFKDRVEMEMGYFYIGPNYNALANPFIQKNRHGLIVKMNGRIGERLDVAGEVRYGKSVDKSILLGGDYKNHQLLGSFNWRPFNNVNVSGQITPNTFEQTGFAETTFSGSNMLYNLQVNTQNKINESVLLSSVGLTNFNSKLSYIDTSWTNKSEQVFIQNALVFKNRSSLSMMAMVGFVKDGNPELPRQTTVFSQLDYGLDKEKWRVTVGVQGLKDSFIREWFYGFTSFGELRISDQLQIGFDASYQLPVASSSKQKKRFWGRLELTKQF